MAESTTALVSQAALLTAGRRREVPHRIVGQADRLTAAWDYTVRPSLGVAGITVPSTVLSTLSLRFHADASRRTVWLMIDRDAVSVSGALSITVDDGSGAVSSSYTAAGVAGADLALAWATEMATDLGSDWEVLAVDIMGDGLDAVRLTRSGDPTAALLDFSVDALSGPEAARVYLIREPIKYTTLTLWTRQQPVNVGGLGGTEVTRRQAGAWGYLADYAGITEDGLTLLDLRLAGVQEVWPQLGTGTFPESAPTVVTSGSGVYGVYTALSIELAVAVT